jgi:hypothetical protein
MTDQVMAIQARSASVLHTVAGHTDYHPAKTIAGYRQFVADSSLRKHKSPHPQDSKNVLAGSNSSKSGVALRGRSTPLGVRSRSRAQFGECRAGVQQ